ncbi:4-(cytidine 5'-diphospho)-2-C-methyl-D-erythritol kinase [Cerasicoccus arenae]|uniref:4-diphosphocytidyl-2-C-methyl-D-erythritol kinase n=1 Tax=Cerasicoccus arenae TaxID=424488 RepID=A0A8J3DM27_9BACT|nr:4-(cytidine 5'-diphospho)-2-C-methyl-D-erythritol kinase [Cerasicoccus arenae]MBK1858345.1 4-(cytidine 5'-diphospho)-2-C-methyl-D-erythritol kinase [Cerasicoccus arenae]GHC09699.1 4-diphosphocytidyl-2-C-methyl-D-erythritol kinase [Cerasicoccus arenae]
MSSLTLLSPAKVNLVLAITGVRADGFHDLVSLVAPVAFGDQVTVTLTNEGGGDQLTCDFPGVPTDSTNLALRAVEAFRRRHPFEASVRVDLDKKIPAGAGLGGGSSNASTVLSSINELLDKPLTINELIEVSSELGSDCPLFLAQKPVIMRGRGDQLESLATAAEEALSGQRLILFKPSFGVETGWAYGRMKANGTWYCPATEAEAMLAEWQAGSDLCKVPLFNNMQQAAFEKFLALPVLLELIRERHDARCIMSGSGSACLVWLEPDMASESIIATIQECLGEAAFWVETSIA